MCHHWEVLSTGNYKITFVSHDTCNRIFFEEYNYLNCNEECNADYISKLTPGTPPYYKWSFTPFRIEKLLNSPIINLPQMLSISNISWMRQSMSTKSVELSPLLYAFIVVMGHHFIFYISYLHFLYDLTLCLYGGSLVYVSHHIVDLCSLINSAINK